jgi:hypothetical protein
VERLIGERAGAESPETTPSALAIATRRFVTFHLVCLGWVFFRAESFSTATTLLSRLAAFGPAPNLTPAVVALVVGGIAIHYVPKHVRLQIRFQFGRLRPLPMAAVLAVALLFVDGLGPEGVAPFIYFQF